MHYYQQAQQQQIITLPGGQQVAVRMGTQQPQVMQFQQPSCMQQTMVSVQIPVSQNGQTVYQTVQMPMQMSAPAMQTAMIPQVIQTSAGQQVSLHFCKQQNLNLNTVTVGPRKCPKM
jgi:hypothetical protein